MTGRLTPKPLGNGGLGKPRFQEMLE